MLILALIFVEFARHNSCLAMEMALPKAKHGAISDREGLFSSKARIGRKTGRPSVANAFRKEGLAPASNFCPRVAMQTWD
jgi:hypothetical protein